MFTVKICGITSIPDALVVAEAGGDAVGLNFYPKSSRYVHPQAAQAISRALPSSVSRVGVFVNESTTAIGEIVRRVGLDCVQLHGDEPAELLRELPTTVSVIRAVRTEGGLEAAAEFLFACRQAGRVPDAILVDAQVPGAFGGTGHSVDWRGLAEQRAILGEVPLILAGGLTPENVRTAIETVRPRGVDTASGVETAPGVKDPNAVRSFIQVSRETLSASGGAPAP